MSVAGVPAVGLAEAEGTYLADRSSSGAEELDPLRIAATALEAEILYFARLYDETIQKSQYVIKMQPDYGIAYEYLGYAYAAKGMYSEAIAEYKKLINLEKAARTGIQCYLGYAYAKSGKRDEALAILNQ
jgi:tetratricopeptide (TPR) repeat protein